MLQLRRIPLYSLPISTLRNFDSKPLHRINPTNGMRKPNLTVGLCNTMPECLASQLPLALSLSRFHQHWNLHCTC